MYICYVEESGDSGTFDIHEPISNPLFIVMGIFIDHTCLLPLTNEFLRIKRYFFPSLMCPVPHFLDCIELERKGKDIRKAIRSGARRFRQQSIGFLDACLELLRKNNARLLGKALIKNPGRINSDAGFYGRSVLHICEHFNAFLEMKNEWGFVVGDSRRTTQNRRTTHTVFTQMHRINGNSYPRLVEPPVYGHSNNFAMLQLADLVCSAILFPAVIDAFGDHLQGSPNIHVSPKYSIIRTRYKDMLNAMQFMHRDATARRVGGLLVSDMTGLNRKTSRLFE